MRDELEARDLTPTFGVEVSGLDPEVPLAPDVVDRLRQLLDDRSVLVFRDMDVDPEFQRYLMWTLIGEELPALAPGTRPSLVSNKEPGGGAPYGRLLFHSDAMWAERPEPILSLYGIEVEQPSVPTVFVSMVDAWRTLPAPLRERVEDLQARHGHEHYYPNRGGDDDVLDARFDEPHSTVKPVGFVHPRTGRRTLYVSQQMTMGIVGLADEENEELLAKLFAHLYDDVATYRHEWRTGDLVVWDNIALQHARGTVDLEGPARTLRKVTGPVYISGTQRKVPSFSKDSA
jgi:alpha-ketoglutarate-dependent taurine dioxygenase